MAASAVLSSSCAHAGLRWNGGGWGGGRDVREALRPPARPRQRAPARAGPHCPGRALRCKRAADAPVPVDARAAGQSLGAASGRRRVAPHLRQHLVRHSDGGLQVDGLEMQQAPRPLHRRPAAGPTRRVSQRRHEEPSAASTAAAFFDTGSTRARRVRPARSAMPAVDRSADMRSWFDRMSSRAPGAEAASAGSASAAAAAARTAGALKAAARRSTPVSGCSQGSGAPTSAPAGAAAPAAAGRFPVVGGLQRRQQRTEPRRLHSQQLPLSARRRRRSGERRRRRLRRAGSRRPPAAQPASAAATDHGPELRETPRIVGDRVFR